MQSGDVVHFVSRITRIPVRAGYIWGCVGTFQDTPTWSQGDVVVLWNQRTTDTLLIIGGMPWVNNLPVPTCCSSSDRASSLALILQRMPLFLGYTAGLLHGPPLYPGG